MTKRFQEMDVMRGIAIIAVILIHISSFAIDGSSNFLMGNIALFLNQLTRFAVPVFLMLSGWGLTVSKKYEMKYVPLLFNQISKVIFFYLMWNVIYYIVSFDSFSLFEMVKGMILGSTYYHLYYVPLIIFFYMIYPLIYRLAKLNSGLVIAFFITVFSQYADFIFKIEMLNSGVNVFNWLFFFVFGIWFANDLDSKVIFIKKHARILLLLFVMSVSIVFAEAYITFEALGKSLATTSMRPSVIILSTAFFIMVIALDWKNNMVRKYILKISKVSYGMYLSHALVLAVFNILWNENGFTPGSIIYIVSAFFIVTPVSYLIGNIMHSIERTIVSIPKRKVVN